MYQIVYTNRMKRDVRRAKKRGKDMRKLVAVWHSCNTDNHSPTTAETIRLVEICGIFGSATLSWIGCSCTSFLRID